MYTILKDIKVIELASVLAGPSVGMFFAELGAQVIKIENKSTGGDITRKWKLAKEDPDSPISAYFASINWGKECIMLDLADEEDQKKVFELVKDADVVLSNFKASAAERMRMDYKTLGDLNPKLVYAYLNGFPDNEDRVAFDVVLQAEAGFMHMNGEVDGPPVKMPVALIDILAGHQLKEAVLLALWQRERTGKGCFVETSLLESAIASLANQATNWLMAGHLPERMGTRHPNIAPYGDSYLCKDGKSIIVAAGTEKQFRQLCEVLDIQNIASDARFNTNESRVKHRDDLSALLEVAFSKVDSTLALPLLHTAQVPAGTIRNMREVFELPTAQQMVIQDKNQGLISVKSVAFRI